MRFKLLKSAISIFVLVFSICNTSDRANFAENIENKYTKCVQTFAETAIDMLIATKNVIAKNQELINRDPIQGTITSKGLYPL